MCVNFLKLSNVKFCLCMFLYLLYLCLLVNLFKFYIFL